MKNTEDITDILRKRAIEPHFQGIINFYTEEYFSFEALVRPKAGLTRLMPDQLFAMAEKANCLQELDNLCINQAIDYFKKKELPGLLFVNILPISLGSFIDSLSITEHEQALKGIVFELSEKHPSNSIASLKEQIKILQRHGALIAIDDLGSGHSGLISWAEIKPDFVKIDRHLIQNINMDGVKREFVRSIVEIAKGLRCKVIAEGIETIEEMETLHSIGIKLGQGYLFHRPEANPPKTFTKNYCFSNKSTNLLQRRHSETADSIAEQTQVINSNMSAEKVNDLFKNQKQIHCLPIIEDSIPVGIISRNRLLELFSGRYSHALYGHKKISQFMQKDPIIVDSQTSIQEVAKKITQDSSADLNTDFIITKDKKYYGVGKVNTLLKLLTETQIKHARHSNPLTLLPGNVPINEHIEELIIDQQEFYLAYLDINHFKPFNDHFGYSYGDEVIKKLSEIILEKTTEHKDMAGHIGGDDFVIIFRSNDWQEKCESILKEFSAFILRYYSKEQIINRGTWCQDRRGNREFFDLLSLAIGVVNPDVYSQLSHHEVAELATNAKKQAKLHNGNFLFISRRRKHSPSQLQSAAINTQQAS